MRVRNWEGMEEAVAVAEAGSFVAAAERLSVSTSHVSRVIARLEERIQMRLFDRTTRWVRLTDTGRTFVEHCQRIIQDREELLACAGGSAEPRGEVRLSCPIALGERFIAPMVMRYAQEHTQISVNLDLTNRVVDVIGEGYDLAVRTGHVSDPRLVAQQIAARPLEVCAAPEYLEQYGEPLHPDELPTHRCLAGTSTTWHFLDGDTPRLFSPKDRWRCNNGNVIASAAVQGLGICQLPSFYVNHYISNRRLTPILREFKSPPEPIWVVFPPKRNLQPKVKWLVNLLKSDLQSTLDAE